MIPKKWKRLAARPLSVILSLLLMCPSALPLASAADAITLYYDLLGDYGATITATNAPLDNQPCSNMLDGSYTVGCSFEAAHNGTTLNEDFFITTTWNDALSMSAVTITGNYPKQQGVLDVDIAVRLSADGEWQTLQAGVTPDWKTNGETPESFTVDLGATVSATGVRLKVNKAGFEWNHFAIREIQIPMVGDAAEPHVRLTANVARKASVTATSELPAEGRPDDVGGPAALTDGKYDVGWASAEWPSYPQDVTLSFGTPQAFDSLKLVCNYAQSQAPTEISILVSADGETWEPVVENQKLVWLTDEGPTGDYNDEKTISFPTVENAKQVRLRIHSSKAQWGKVCIEEIELYSTDTVRLQERRASAVDVEIGNGFAGITNGDDALTMGTDYEIHGRIVTIAASYLSRLTAGQHTLQFAFGTQTLPLNLFVDPLDENEDGSTQRFVSFNLRYDTTSHKLMSLDVRGPHLLELLQKYNPDSIGFQEATDEWMGYLRPHMSEMGYDYVGVGRDTGTDEPNRSSQSNEFEPVFYRRDKYEPIESGTFWLSRTPDVKSGTDFGASNTRICTYVVLQNRWTGAYYAHFNTHLDHVALATQSNEVRIILSRMREITAHYDDIGCVITGDFNSVEYEPDDPTYRPTTYHYMTSYMDDSRKIADNIPVDGPTFNGYQDPDGWSAGNHSWIDTPTLDESALRVTPIDYIYLTKGAYEVSTYTVMNERFTFDYNGKTYRDQPVSDHNGIFCEATYVGNPAAYDESRIIDHPAKTSVWPSDLSKEQTIALAQLRAQNQNATMGATVTSNLTCDGDVANLLDTTNTLQVGNYTGHVYWELDVDLQRAVNVSALACTVGADADKLPTDMEFFLSTDKQTWQKIGGTLLGSPDASSTVYMMLDEPASARYARIVAPYTGNDTALRNLTVYARNPETVGTFPSEAADYTGLMAALNRIPADLSEYETDKIAALADVLRDVSFGYEKNQQSQVDTLTDTINQAIDHLSNKVVTVVFYGKYNEKLALKTVTTGAELRALLTGGVTPPEIHGFAFVGWDASADASDALVEANYNGTLSVQAVYETDRQHTYSLTYDSSRVSAQTAAGSVSADTALTFNTRVTATADASVAYWVLDGVKVGFAARSYTFYISGNNQLSVVLANEDSISATNAVGLQQAHVTGNGSSYTFTVIAQTSVPLGTVSEYGVIYSSSLSTLQALATGKQADASLYTKVVSSKTGANQQYMISLLNVQPNRQRYAIAYAVVNGRTIYSAQYARVYTPADATVTATPEIRTL